MIAESPVLVAVADGIAWITLNRPDVGNAIDLPLAYALVDAAVRCDADASVRCVVLTGAGRLFCAGGDVAAFASAGDGIETLLDELAGTLQRAVAALAALRKPLLVLVNGPAAGGGLGLAIVGDIVLCAQSAHFTAAYGTLGMTPDGGLTWLLPRLVGLRRAQEIALANRRIKAEEAAAIGLVTRTVADDQLMAEGAAMAAQLAATATGAYGVTRALLHQSFTTALVPQLADEARAIARSGGSAAGREGLAAFFAKRRPDFTKAEAN